MSTRQIHVFISHSWCYSHHYDTLSDWVFGKKWRVGQASLDLRNFSVPWTKPIEDAASDRALREAIYRKIARSHVVVIPTGMYVNYSKWIQKEIAGSRQYGRPILAVNLRGQQRISSVVAEAADKLVGWNSESIAKGIWELYKELM